MTTSEFPTQFDYKTAEPRISQKWEETKVFEAEVDETKKPFCVVIPPPNVTGILHMGHVLDNIPQDVMVRWHRMRGFSAVWIPGTDHAGIATQNVVKKMLNKEGIEIEDLGREKFLEHVWAWREKYGNTIISQIKRLGCSCDWRRERFTMDDGLNKAVLTAFLHLHKKGLIYRGKRMVNWCTVCGTALADDEVEHKEESSFIWHIRYPLVEADGKPSTTEFITVATTRPETMLGDTAVAVHPDDDRYKHLHGKHVWLPIENRAIPIIADSFVEKEFGTGVVKITPAHDVNDYQCALRNNLEIRQIITLDGKMNELAGIDFDGLSIIDARKKVVAQLEAESSLVETEKHKHNVGSCYRCNTTIEPMVSNQWFVKMRPLAEAAKKAVEDNRIEIVPSSERPDFFRWMDTIQDWCISRQLWWGHRIPVYYCAHCEHQTVALETPTACEKCGSTHLTQDNDVLDTWFSAQLWPFSTLGWPEKTKELAYWYPNSWLMSGRDILFFWDARMIMAGLELMGDVPFKTLALHGLVRDDKGRKLSKSLNNSPDPIGLFEQYGVDAVRSSIAYRYPMGHQDTKLTEEFYKQGQSVVTKLWNAARYVFLSKSELTASGVPAKGQDKLIEDRWVISQLKKAIIAHDAFLTKSDITHAFESLTNFFWNDFCDWYLESIKPRIRASDETALSTASEVLLTLVKLFHPYAPFVTEELWAKAKELGLTSNNDTQVCVESWPSADLFTDDTEAVQSYTSLQACVKAVREIRHHLVLSPKVKLNAYVEFSNAEIEARFAKVQTLAGDLAVCAIEKGTSAKGYVPFDIGGGVIHLQVPADTDTADVKSKLDKKIEGIKKGVAAVNGRLKNAEFRKNAPPELIEQNEAQLREYEFSEQQIVKVLESL